MAGKNRAWFRRVLWSYMPSSWEGLAVLLAAVLLIVNSDEFAPKAASAFGYPTYSGVAEVGFICIVFLGLWVIAALKSEPKD